MQKRFDKVKQLKQELEDDINSKISKFEELHDLKVSFTVNDGFKIKLGLIIDIDKL